MISDKLYIGTVTLSSNAPSEEHLLPDWHLRPNPKIANVEYIRKDALVEWAKYQMSFEQGYSTGEAEQAYRFAMNDLIDKLNEM